MIKLLVVLAVICISTSSLAVRLTVAPAVWLAFIRLLLSTVILLPFALTRYRRELASLSRNVFLRYALSGIMLGLHFLCYFEALKNTSITAAVVLSCSEAFFVAIGARIFYREPIRTRGWISITIAFLGCVLVTTAKNTQSPNALMGNLLGLLAAILIAVNTLITKGNSKEGSTTTYTLVTYGFAALTLFVATLPWMYPSRENAHGLADRALAVCDMHHSGTQRLSYCLKFERASYVSLPSCCRPHSLPS